MIQNRISGNSSGSTVVTGKVTGGSLSMEYNIAEGTVKGIRASSENYPVQLGAFRFKLNADAFFREVVEYIDRNAIMIREGGLYKVRITKSPIPGKDGNTEQEEQTGLAIAESQDTIQNYDTLTAALNIPDSSAVSSASTGV